MRLMSANVPGLGGGPCRGRAGRYGRFGRPRERRISRRTGRNIGDCSARARGVDDVHVVIRVNDRTCRSPGDGAHVPPTPSTRWASATGDRHIAHKHDWGSLDSRERSSRSCGRAAARRAAAPETRGSTSRRTIFMGRCSAGGGRLPISRCVLHKAACGPRYGRAGRTRADGRRTATVPALQLQQGLGLIGKHNRYSTLEARRSSPGGRGDAGRRAIALACDRRRRFFKAASIRACRHVLILSWVYVFKRVIEASRPAYCSS